MCVHRPIHLLPCLEWTHFHNQHVAAWMCVFHLVEHTKPRDACHTSNAIQMMYGNVRERIYWRLAWSFPALLVQQAEAPGTSLLSDASGTYISGCMA